MQILSSYYFTPLSEPQIAQLRRDLCDYAQQHGLRGLCLIGPEGFNGTLSVPDQHLAECQNKIRDCLQAPDLHFKIATHTHHPFDSFKVKIKDEIITYTKKSRTTSATHPTHPPTNQTQTPTAAVTNPAAAVPPTDQVPSTDTDESNTHVPRSYTPPTSHYKHLSPAQWHQHLQDETAVVLDVRNDYEYQLGHFKNAQHFNLKEFSQIKNHLSAPEGGNKFPRAAKGGRKCPREKLGDTASPSRARDNTQRENIDHLLITSPSRARDNTQDTHAAPSSKTPKGRHPWRKGTKILLYCTGGIRCEKVLVDLENRGFENVHQLSGGILNYLDYIKNQKLNKNTSPNKTPHHLTTINTHNNTIIDTINDTISDTISESVDDTITKGVPQEPEKHSPTSLWQGECFVFDYRVAVDENLEASKQYRICPHCGDPGKLKGHCLQCQKAYTICQKCHDAHVRTCSKNCRARANASATCQQL